MLKRGPLLLVVFAILGSEALACTYESFRVTDRCKAIAKGRGQVGENVSLYFEARDRSFYGTRYTVVNSRGRWKIVEYNIPANVTIDTWACGRGPISGRCNQEP